MITDKLGSYAAARRQIMPAIEHRSHKGLNNQAENSHLPLRHANGQLCFRCDDCGDRR
jgi:putative transposase